ncbi:hypothetical protein IOD16_02395 [Saccharothrix sp. 6-C]|uniref:hypothetical protein n=1 Tax=Saccharothrix sp. 6-C TaxID=2781735 RepID=UPI001917A1A1|nr:hypothetical protein [Saccharothrix sp. 6-C]QQQ77409.1 hypothetical protein IOD16_02395 [Saccharothrix sp. 6-C]
MTTDTVVALPTVTRSGPPAPLPQHETIENLLKGFRRQFVPIRKSFVQQGKGRETKPGPLRNFLAGHDSRGLDAYLLLHAMASSPPWNCDLPSGFWVRALGLVGAATNGANAFDNARPAVSKIMRRLVDRRLVARTRVKGQSSLTLLCEDGSGSAYAHPFDTDEQWLQLPHEYWYGRHYLTLSLRAKIMLLIALARHDNFTLPQNKALPWYGVSEDTAYRGFRELRDADLLHVRQGWIEALRSDIGYTQQWVYSLKGAFSDAERKKASAKAKRDFVNGNREGV